MPELEFPGSRGTRGKSPWRWSRGPWEDGWADQGSVWAGGWGLRRAGYPAAPRRAPAASHEYEPFPPRGVEGAVAAE